MRFRLISQQQSCECMFFLFVYLWLWIQLQYSDGYGFIYSVVMLAAADAIQFLCIHSPEGFMQQILYFVFSLVFMWAFHYILTTGCHYKQNRRVLP